MLGADSDFIPVNPADIKLEELHKKLILAEEEIKRLNGLIAILRYEDRVSTSTI